MSAHQPKMVNAEGEEVIVRHRPGTMVPGRVTGVEAIGESGDYRLVFQVDSLWIATTREQMKERGE